MAPVCRVELDSGQKSSLAPVRQSGVMAATPLHPEPKRKMEEPSILCSSKRWQKILNTQPNWQSLMEEEDYKHVLVLMELLSFPPSATPSRHFALRRSSTKTRATSDTLPSEGFLGTASGPGTFTALRYFWGVRKNTSDRSWGMASNFTPLCFQSAELSTLLSKADDSGELIISPFLFGYLNKWQWGLLCGPALTRTQLEMFLL